MSDEQRSLLIEYDEPVGTMMEDLLMAILGVFGWKLERAYRDDYDRGIWDPKRCMYFEQEVKERGSAGNIPNE